MDVLIECYSFVAHMTRRYYRKEEKCGVGLHQHKERAFNDLYSCLQAKTSGKRPNALISSLYVIKMLHIGGYQVTLV